MLKTSQKNTGGFYMFGMFKKVEPSNEKIAIFCSWFVNNSNRIITSMKNRENDEDTMFAVLDEVETQLAVVYGDGYKGDIEFEYGFNTDIDKWEFNLFHLNNKFLIKATAKIADILNDQICDTWYVNTGSFT